MASDPNHSDEENQRKEAARLVGNLKGSWKFSYGEDVDFCIVSSRYFHSNTHHYGQHGLTLEHLLRPLLSEQKSIRGEEESRWLTGNQRAKIVELYAEEAASRSNKSDSHGNKISAAQLEKALKTSKA